MPVMQGGGTAAGHRFTIRDVQEIDRNGRVAQSAGLARRGPSRASAVVMPPAAMGRKKMARMAADDGAPAGGEGDEAKNVFRLSEPPADVSAAVTVAQSFGLARRPRGLCSNAMQVVEIASTIAGVAMTRVVDNQGDVSWELDQMPKDAIHPGGAQTSPSSAAWQTQTITLPGLRCENNLGQETYADFEVNFKYNGASLGYIEVTATKAQDAWGWGLVVKEGITVDPNVYDTAPPTGARFAAVKLRFHFRFDHSPWQDIIGYIDLTLYGNGTFAETSRWTQS